MPIAKNLFDRGQRQYIATIKVCFSDVYDFYQKMLKIKCRKIDSVFDHQSVKMCRIIQQNYVRLSQNKPTGINSNAANKN